MPQKNDVKKPPHNQTLLEWHTPEFIQHKKGGWWYLVIGIVLSGLLAYSLASKAYTMTAGLALVSILLFVNHKKDPKILTVKITELGVEYGNQHLAYHDIQAFWIVYRQPYVRSLYLRLSGNKPQLIHIELNHQDPVMVRRLLSQELPEIEGAKQPALDVLSRLMRLS